MSWYGYLYVKRTEAHSGSPRPHLSLRRFSAHLKANGPHLVGRVTGSGKISAGFYFEIFETHVELISLCD
jgi:hypothetical protein